MELLDINDPHPKKNNRRWFIRLSLLGAGGVAAAGSWAWNRGVFKPTRGDAYAAWEQWQGGEDPKLRLISAAVLAPSKHNTQPWEFRVEKGYINIFVDVFRTLGAVDPLHREAYFSTGCCMTNLLLAADVEGFKATPEFLPDREFLWNWAARIDLEPGEKKKGGDLYNAIPRRHTNRGPYDMARSVAPPVLDELAKTASADGIRTVWLDKERQKAFGALTVESTEAMLADDQGIDAAPWYRSSFEAIQTEADGLTMEAATFPPRDALLKKFFAGPSAQDFDAHWTAMTRRNVASMPATGIMVVPDGKDPVSAITAGMAWQRMALHATSLGLVMQPLTASIERADREISTSAEPRVGNALREIAGGQGDVMFAFRVGYPTVPSVVSPRRGVDLVVFSDKKKKKKRPTVA